MIHRLARSLALAAFGTSSLALAQPAPGPAPVPALLPAPAPAPPPRADVAPPRVRSDDPALPPAERVALHPYIVSLGARTMYVSNGGFDSFSDRNWLTAFSLGAGRSVYAQGAVSVALMAFWDAGGKESSVRGESTELFVHRLSLGPELRWHPLSDGYVLARVSPAALRTTASLKESSTGSTYRVSSDDADLGELSNWDFGVDLAAGLAYELFGSAGRRSGPVRFWVAGEGGYAWASSTALDWLPESDDPSTPERVAVLDQGELGVRGPFLRFVAAATF
jgi:hypothetical protein